MTSSNPLVLHGRHFGRTVFALCNYPALLAAGILQLEELQGSPIEDYLADVQREHRVFTNLIDSYPGLLDRLVKGEEEDILHMGELLGKGAAGAQGNNTKTLKSAVLEWLVPRGQAVIPPLSRNIKSDPRFNHEVTGALLCPAGLDWSNTETKQSLKSSETAVYGDQWPMFLYAGFKHVFTSPSSVDREPKAMQSGNAYLHGMKCVTQGSLAYVAMQIRFSLSLSSVFLRTDTVMDSKNFYHSILNLLEDPEESEEVTDLMMWWMRRVFPNSSSLQRTISKNSALSKIQEKCAALQEQATADAN
ncbi:uncharacterized protein HD556DRAFT_1433420 [Suillus plorans]|uniref:Uncharacterized protein n=1 Tax=Suillus plorans TaxID=116603 RepID=A0A9P7AIS8_9AGAM|nr:uncharacterized protein HD556DRAFT_1433420 [Suillus plorans]KAG1790357.1 hypothetical protein HD556DRAFT_1433420 [Suillus plorans]